MDSKKTQKIVVVVLIITALLGIAGALLVYYLSTKDKKDIQQTDVAEYCACITAYTTSSCSDCFCNEIETQTLESQIGEVRNGVCSLECPATEVIEGEEEVEDSGVIKCLIPKVKADTCHSVTIRDSQTRELITPPINVDKPILISATFVPGEFNGEEEVFTKFVFVINGESTEIEADKAPSTLVDGTKTYLPEFEFSSFEDINTLTIQATAYSNKEPNGATAGKYCYKQYDLQQEQGAFCSDMAVNIGEGVTPNSAVVNLIELKTPGVTKEDNVSIEFAFNHQNLRTVKTKNLPQNIIDEILVNETLFLEYEHLYSTPSLFAEGESFPKFDSENVDVNALRISATVFLDNTALDSSLCTDNVFFSWEPVETPDPDPTDIGEDDDDDDTEKPEIQVAMTGSTCVKTAKNETDLNRTNYTITITNNSDTAQELKSITNKLPLGFRYLEDTTEINKTAETDEILEVTSVGESQELAWSDTWWIQSQESLTLEYGVNVTTKALEGSNQNEVVVTPVNIPEDMSKLRAEFVTSVAANCQTETETPPPTDTDPTEPETDPDEDLPETGLLPIVTFGVGILALIFGLLVHYGKISVIDSAILKVINAKIIKKNFMPIEYFEESILEKEEKKKK